MRWFRPNVDATLTEFFDAARKESTDTAALRIDAVERSMRDAVEELAPARFTEPERTVLAAERQFHPDGAAARVAQPEALLELLPAYLQDRRWRPESIDVRRTRLSAVVALSGQVADGSDAEGLVEVKHHVDEAIGREARSIRDARIAGDTGTIQQIPLTGPIMKVVQPGTGRHRAAGPS